MPPEEKKSTKKGIATKKKKKMYRVLRKEDERGMVMVLILLVMVMLVIVGSVLLVTSLTENQISTNDVAAVQGFYVAEAGLQTALKDLNTGGTGSVSGTVGSGQYTASATAADPPTGQKRIDAYGYVPNSASPRAVKRVSMLVYRPSPFRWGGFGESQVDIVADSNTDSYDSEVGPYGGSNVSPNGDVGSNGNISLAAGCTVNGDATAGGTISGIAGCTITGTSTPDAPHVDLSSVDFPSGTYTASVPPGSPAMLVSYNSTTGNLTVGPGATLTLPAPGYFKDVSVTAGSTLTLSAPGAYCFHDLSVLAGSSLRIAPGGHVDIYVSRKLDMAAGSLANLSGLPTNVSIWGCGTDTTPWSISAGSGCALALYAPNHPVTVAAGGAVYGSIIGATISESAGCYFHYDEALARQPGNGKYIVAPRSWTELNP